MQEVELFEEEMMRQFDTYLQSIVRRSVKGKLLGMVEYHLGWRNEELQEVTHQGKGKRGRPKLGMLIHLLFSDSYLKTFPSAAAIEFIHSASLVYDDIQDEDEMRRGKPAVWKLWGKDEAINVGSSLQTLAFTMISEMRKAYGSNRAIMIMQYLTHIMLRMCQGQQSDIQMAKSTDLPDGRQYLEMIDGKTAALFEASAYLGSVAAGAGKKNEVICQFFGKSLGTAFQIFDDAVGICGIMERGIDKPAADLEHRKKTYPIIKTFLECGDCEEKALLRKYFSTNSMTADDYDRIRQIITKYRVHEQTLSLGLNYLSESIGILRSINGNEAIQLQIEQWILLMMAAQLAAVGVEAEVMSAYFKASTGTWKVNNKNKITGTLKI